MNYKIDPWRVIEQDFDPQQHLATESLFALGNGHFGGRANFEEHYSGQTLAGQYIGGVYYPDKTRVGWWKNGYPEYFAKVLNSAFWIGVDLLVDGQQLDLSKVQIKDFNRELDMQRGTLSRKVRAVMANGVELQIEVLRFISLPEQELGAIKYSVTPLNRPAQITFSPYIDSNVRNSDANYDEKFWELVATDRDATQSRTRKSGFEAAWAQAVELDGAEFLCTSQPEVVRHTTTLKLEKGCCATLYKYASVCSSLNHPAPELLQAAREVVSNAKERGFATLLCQHTQAWAERWAGCDIAIEGDPSSQQAIRFCIFQLMQTYTGVDPRLNIGPKGFTGEKYGGVTYWDTEAYCLPFYLSTAGQDVARELLIYRYNQLDKAIENGTKLGFKDGAALYPMVTINGEECHNEWEITFEEIHRNGAIAFAIYNYLRYTGDNAYLADYGLEVLLSIARFWSQRITFSQSRSQYVMLGVTGPNEYENNVNNNWYTSYIALWSMRYAAQAAQWVRTNCPDDYARICQKRAFDEPIETLRWREIIDNMYLGYDQNLGVFLQQDGYLDKEQILAADLDPSQRPINQKWSWDRILRSCFIKQADVLQGLYLFADDFDQATLRRNFDFYESRTLHESSLSPCVHSVLASRLGDRDKAYELYLRTSRLDLDDYNCEVREGCHVTSMAGSWLSVVEGFGGMRMVDGRLTFSPQLPSQWSSLSFRVNYRGRLITLKADHIQATLTLEGEPVELALCGHQITLIDTFTCKYNQ